MGKKERSDCRIINEKKGRTRSTGGALLRQEGEKGVVRHVDLDEWLDTGPEHVSKQDWIVGRPSSRYRSLADYMTSPNLVQGSWLASGIPAHVHLYSEWQAAPESVSMVATAVAQVQHMRPVMQAIHESQSILDLPANWDDNGAQPVRRETLEKATQLLVAYASYLDEHFVCSLAAPQIDAVPDGSIDLFWKEPKGQLLINIKPDATVAAFYGDSYNEGDTIKGKIPLDGVKEYLAVWMKTLSTG